MNIRAIFFDIDGTLLVNDSKHKMPESTLRALQMARAKGIRLFVATGRVPAMATPLWELFPFDGILAMTGQYCYDCSGNLLHTLPIHKEDIRRLMEIQEKDPFPCLIAEGDASFMASYTERIARHFALHDLPAPELYDVRRADTHDVYQLIVYDPEINNPKLAPLQHIRITNAATYCHDVIPESGGKHIGIRAVAAHYGISPDEILVFGDGKNDVDMLTHAGFGIAMGNACPEAKAAADYITDPITEDGIFNALRHFGII